MKNVNSQKITCTIPGEVFDRFTAYNQDHEEQPLKMSVILKKAVDGILKEKGY
jgi:hypothetical protein